MGDRLLEAIQCPILLMHGAHSLGSTMRPQDVGRVLARLRDCTVVSSLDQGHSIHGPSTREFVMKVGQFLGRV